MKIPAGQIISHSTQYSWPVLHVVLVMFRCLPHIVIHAAVCVCIMMSSLVYIFYWMPELSATYNSKLFSLQEWHLLAQYCGQSARCLLIEFSSINKALKSERWIWQQVLPQEVVCNSKKVEILPNLVMRHVLQ